MHMSMRGDLWPSPAGFLLVLACFALPFVGWSTDPSPIVDVTYRGTDLVVGATAEVTVVRPADHALPEPWRTEGIPGTLPAITELQPVAVASLALVILGVALAALPWRRTRALAATATASAAACLIAVLVYMSGNVATPFMYLTKAVSHNVPGGAFLAFIALVALAVWNLVLAVRPLRSPRPPRDGDPPSEIGPYLSGSWPARPFEPHSGVIRKIQARVDDA